MAISEILGLTMQTFESTALVTSAYLGEEAGVWGRVTRYSTQQLKNLLGDPVVENLPANAGHTGPIPGLGRLHMLQSN